MHKRAFQLSAHEHKNYVRIITAPFHFNHLPNKVQNYLHCSQDSESAKILEHFLGELTFTIGCLDLHNIQPCKLLFGTVVYGYYMDQNPKKIFYCINFEALYGVFVLQWELQ